MLRAFAILARALGVLSLSVLVARPAMAGPHRHDGFYARFSAGLSALDVGRNTEGAGPGESVTFVGDSSSVSGGALSLEASFGGTPFERVALAGTVLVELLSAPDLRLIDGSSVDLKDPFAFILIAPSVDVFPGREHGFRLGAAAGLAHVAGRIRDPTFDSFGGTGGGAMLAVGYDGWVGEEWSVGLTLRGVFALVRGERSAHGFRATETDRITSVGLAATLLFH